MKIGIIGATGNAGRAIHAEATRRGHDVTAVVRNPDRAREVLGADATVLTRDAFDLVVDDLRDFDVVVDAFATAPEHAHLHVDLAARLVAMFRGVDAPRLVFILGAGSLTTGPDEHLALDDIRGVPGAEAWIAIPQSQLEELRFLRDVDDVDWVAVSPSLTFVAGAATDYVLGRDELLVAPDGSSSVTSGTLAVALIDEIENPAHVRTRFTVRDA